ncbi:hypothetical protein LZ318_11675 [Saccharopolyspora indica]|uniref:hypothetical protein n=1 Tax=Saccharopolyspora indica TaxID=1229659 RepID=UPI0022EAA6A8|nr:hypothetical protein [Saccharopolyspora indica]MDA3643830.1 hypothetical protein [Saccharopolyspora indica]
MKRSLLVVGTALAVSGCAPSIPAAPRPPAETVTVAAQPEAEATSGDIGDGTHIVGSDIEPGTYSTDGPSNDRRACSWARLSDTTGDTSSYLASGYEKGKATVTIKESDGAFRTQGGCTWVKK